MKSNADAVLSAKSLHYFLQLIDSMSYTQAAQILGITQPALTQQIKKLEKAVGSPLFGQVGKKLYLTDAGIEMEETAHKLLNTVQGAIDTIQQYTNSDTGEISIGALNTFDPSILEEFLISFNKKYPEIKLSFTFYDRKELWNKVDHNELDFAVIYIPDHNANPASMNQYWTEKIYDDSLVVLSPKEQRKLADIVKQKWVSYPRGSYLPQTFDRFYAGKIPEKGLDISARFSDMNQLANFAQANSYNTFVTKSFYEVNKNKIKLYPVKAVPKIEFQSCFLYRKNKSDIPRLTNFLEEWRSFLKAKDYSSRLDDYSTLI
ncbi:LysR family transcriptional regulator [uncultured Lactobacillus sp.]|uniref:LysR family transcriptional regulator n=1 Tax=uncultured Lactobacillus sp. TaxID=153152 RepID=UPI00261CE91F|nr:LysR family transcriptional regulator [uncultured Lactobacillus sp.]